jgi:hypothetical protein
MGVRERVREAIQAPVEAAAEELRELQDADVETRLTLLIDGWARGLAAALEELAVAIDDLERRRPVPSAGEQPAVPAVEEPARDVGDRPEELDLEGAGEDRLIDEARHSRAATAELRKEGDEARRRLEG